MLRMGCVGGTEDGMCVSGVKDGVEGPMMD